MHTHLEFRFTLSNGLWVAGTYLAGDTLSLCQEGVRDVWQVPQSATELWIQVTEVSFGETTPVVFTEDGEAIVWIEDDTIVLELGYDTYQILRTDHAIKAGRWYYMRAWYA